MDIVAALIVAIYDNLNVGINGGFNVGFNGGFNVGLHGSLHCELLLVCRGVNRLAFLVLSVDSLGG